jgi:L-asparagine transporter-like permease
MAMIMFSFSGNKLVGITTAEADNPQKSIPKATTSGHLPYLDLVYWFTGGSTFALLMEQSG